MLPSPSILPLNSALQPGTGLENDLTPTESHSLLPHRDLMEYKSNKPYCQFDRSGYDPLSAPDASTNNGGVQEAQDPRNLGQIHDPKMTLFL
jgi:hypothetical protein